MTMKNRVRFTQCPTKAVGFALVASLLAGGAAFAASETNMSSGTPDPSVIAMNQKARGNAVSITYAFLPTDGTLDIYSVDSSGKVGATPLGKITLKAGVYHDIPVDLSSAPKEGMRLRAVLEKSGQPFKNAGDVPERTFKIL